MKALMEKLEHLLELGGIKKDITLLVISGIAVICSLANVQPFPFDIAWAAIILCGVPIILEAVIGLVTAFDIKADVLVSLALIASICIGETFAAGEVAFIMQLGALLEELTVAKARAGIEKLVHLTPQTARVLHNGKETVIPAQEVRVGDLLRVLPGESVPVDGVITFGQTSINQAVMTGESLPVDKGVGDEVSSGTVNQFGAFELKAVKVGEDSSIQRMIRLVQSADAGKAKIVGIADRWATWIVVIALSAAALTWLFTGQIIRAVTILVVFCPCALVLATPTAVMAAIGNATRHGFLVREGDALERLARVKLVAFDKTGTLTYGTPKVVAAKSLSDSYTDRELYRLAASAEVLSEHPLGKAIVDCYKKSSGPAVSPADGFQMVPGRGVFVTVDGKKILAGNTELLHERGIDFMSPAEADAYVEQGCTVTYLAVDGQFAGYIALSDTLRKESENTIVKLFALKVQPVLLTGDHENAANTIAAQLDIRQVRANCLPQDKLDYIDKVQRSGEPVCMIGDGINDAPALKMAEVGIAMGGVGSDIAVDAADIALVDDEVKELPHLIALSKRMMTTIKLNMTFSMALNFLAIVLAIFGALNPVVGALIHNAGSVLVIMNSALLLKWKKE
ncbi:heavy metal translocating P-type ATPase [Anaerotruncus colihominis]|uniref:heavy metal translocating P-type ATPase n=1 Tax=Anaerotruncus colihominis TaxID=169435 RepID=UPI0018979CA5|nr:cation-translocating P-type ATPase [Anaerotruncus colihominis]MBS4989951.1 cation-translocating P-type ATPase [Anaerotruncus colihominis]